MKLTYTIAILAFVSLVLAAPSPQARAQDTLLVQWSSDNVNPTYNALYDAVRGDTLANGTRKNLNRIYKLKKGGFYWNTERIENIDRFGTTFPLRIVGETPGATYLDNPAVLQMVARKPAGTVDGRIITGKADVMLKNLWLTGRDDNGVQTYYQPLQMDANNSRFIIDNCILEQTNFALIAWTGSGNKIYYTNNKFRNLIGQPSTQQWEGRGISIWADQDTVIVENNTFFNLEFTAFQLEGGSAKYLRFNHNTMVNIGRNFNTGGWFREAYFANCLIVNGFWQGEGPTDYNAAGRDPRAYNSGMWGIAPLPSKYGPEEGRRILLANTAAYLDPAFKSRYGDTIRAQYFINRVTKEDFLDKSAQYTQMKVKDTTWYTSRPNFPTYFSAGFIDSMWKNISDLRKGTTPATPYFYMPTTYPTDIRWPLPENFSYTTPAPLLTAGTDGLPLGDLNWFPTQKATFEANKTTYVAQMQSLAGQQIVIVPVAGFEAEQGTLGGSATISPFAGFSYFKMDGGGFIQWAFDLTTGAKYDLNIWTNMRGNSQRGQRIIVNRVSIHDKAHGWGEYIWDVNLGPHKGMDINNWTWTRIQQDSINEAGALTFKTGKDTIRIESSWGYQNFAGFDLLTPGTSTVVKSLRAPDVTSYDIVTPQAEGAAWVPQEFKSVAMGATGTVTWNMTPASAGNYMMNVFYQNYGSTQAGTLQIDGGTPINMSFVGKADSTGLKLLSSPFALTAAAHTFKLTVPNIKVDWFQLNKQTVISDVEEGAVPFEYALSQNYPNPFNPSTRILFTLAKSGYTTLTVFNLLGQRVATLIDGQMAAGAHVVDFSAKNLSTGVYFYRLESGGFVSHKKMLLLK